MQKLHLVITPAAALYCGARYGQAHFAVVATDAFGGVDKDDAGLVLVHRRRRTDAHADRFLAVVASNRNVVGEHILSERVVIPLHPTPAGIFRHTPPFDAIARSFLSLQAIMQVLQPVQVAMSI